MHRSAARPGGALSFVHNVQKMQANFGVGELEK